MGKGVILSELCALTGWTRRHARRALAEVLDPGPPRPRRLRPRIYDREVVDALRRVWRIAGGPAGKRLAPFMSEFIEALERHGELTLDPVLRQRLCGMSAATIDRALASERKRLQVRGRHGTKPGTLLRQQIPIRTFAEWDDARPGFCEIDTVGHEGGVASGQFCVTLTVTDVATGWTEMQAVQNKAQVWVHGALRDIAERLPFSLLGVDSDNGGEFISDNLLRWCVDRGITFTRTRPYRKNDNCFVEQKNWTVVRQHVGYARYDTPAEVRLLNELYGVLRLWVNYFSPQQKLASKTRRGAKVSRRYDTARTPYRRLLDSTGVADAAKRKLDAEYRRLNPAALSREIGRLQKQLVALAARKRPPAPGMPQGHRWRSDLVLPGIGRLRRPDGSWEAPQPIESTKTGPSNARRGRSGDRRDPDTTRSTGSAQRAVAAMIPKGGEALTRRDPLEDISREAMNHATRTS
jgi:hypothetical protein